MKKTLACAGALLLAASGAMAQDVAHAVEGTVTKVDSSAKTVAVKTADGTEKTFHYTKDATVHGAGDAKAGAVHTVDGLKEGTKVAVHYTEIGGKDTTHEVDKIGDDGLKATKGTVTHVDRGAKTIAVKTADGTEETFHMTDRVAKDGGKDIAAGADKSAKVTVYYTEKAGTKTAHFVKEVF